MMRKLLFIPFSVVGGLIAGLLSKKFVDVTWGLVDDEEPPEPGDREVSLGKLALALTIQGAIFALVRGLVERGRVTHITGSPAPGRKTRSPSRPGSSRRRSGGDLARPPPSLL